MLVSIFYLFYDGTSIFRQGFMEARGFIGNTSRIIQPRICGLSLFNTNCVRPYCIATISAFFYLLLMNSLTVFNLNLKEKPHEPFGIFRAFRIDLQGQIYETTTFYLIFRVITNQQCQKSSQYSIYVDNSVLLYFSTFAKNVGAQKLLPHLIKACPRKETNITLVKYLAQILQYMQ